MQKKNLHQHESLISVVSRALKLLVVVVLASFIFSADAFAQYINCQENPPNGEGNGITYSQKDTIKIVRTTAPPGDTLVWVPVFCKTDSIMSGFAILIAWDRNKVAPSVVTDTVGPIDIDYVRSQVTGRFLQVNPQNPNDTTTNFFSQISQNPFDSGFIICGYNLTAPPGEVVPTTPPGAGVIFRLGFRLFDSVADGDSALIRFYTVQPILFVDPEPIILDCRLSEIAVDWRPAPAPVVLYPRPIKGYIVADATPPAQVGLFSAQPSSITQGANSILRYIVSSADSMQVTGTNGFSFKTSTNFDSTLIVQPGSTTTYTLTAFSVEGNATANVTVTVTTGGGGPNPNAPSISFPDGNSFTIEQGQTISFRVRATDADSGNTVTLEATSKPNNSTFNTVIGTQSVEGIFSFTPDFNQSGTFTATFRASDNTTQFNTASATINVTELQFDRLFSTSAEGQAPVGGLRGKRNIAFPINMITQQTVYGFQFDMAYDANALQLDSFTVTSRTPDYVVYDDIGGSPGQVRVVAFGLANDSLVTDSSSTAVLNSYWSLDSEAVPWSDYLIDMTDGRESIDPNPAVPSLQLLTDPGIIQIDKPGDVNLDKRIDVADLVNIVAYIVGNFGLPLRQFETADIIRNDTVNVFDLVATINTIFNVSVSPVPPPPVSGPPAVLALEYNDLYAGQTDILLVKSALPERVAAAELEIKYDRSVVALGAPQLGLDAKGMALQYKYLSDGTMKIVLHITNPHNVDQQLPTGPNVEILRIPLLGQQILQAGNKNQLRLNKALLSTSGSASIRVEGIEDEPVLPTAFELFQNYPNPFNPFTTVEFSIGTGENGSAVQHASLDIYNILGQRVKNLMDDDLPAGKYRVEWDATNESGQRVATGVYFYRLVVGSHKQSKKMLLLK